MFYDYRYNAFITIFSLILIPLTIALDIVYNKTQIKTKKMDDLTKFSWSVYCNLQPNRLRCGKLGTVRRYFYDIKTRECVRYEYGHCKLNFNMFTNRRTCKSQCIDEAYRGDFTNLTENVYCRFQPDFGHCNSYFPMWYFDISEFKCKGFSFSGCGGNYNRFPTAQECITMCGSVVGLT